MAEDLGEKTEAATPRRLAEARERGQVAKSQDLASALDLIAAGGLLGLLGAFFAGSLAGVLRRVLEHDALSPTLDGLGDLVRDIALHAAWGALPMLAGVLIASFLSHFLQVGPLWVNDALRLRFDRLDPVAGFGRLLGRRALVKTFLNFVKMAVVLGVGYLVLKNDFGKVAGLPRLPLGEGLSVVAALSIKVAAVLLALLLVLGLADYAYQRWQHAQELRMTKDEVKDERRSMEGDPKVKSARARLARQIALHRVNQAVPEADVIVTNPTHYSVALRYERDGGGAPRVVAKGVDHLALRIRQLATRHEVPIVERPPLARALYAGCEVGQEIPQELYQAVAEVLAYVYRLREEAGVAA